MDKLNQVVELAHQKLEQVAYDPVHGLTHHADVWQQAQRISHDINEDFNDQVLQISCWWHDIKDPGVKGASDSAQSAAEAMKQAGYEDADIEAVKEAIQNHEYNDQPTTVEGRILWDADKLTILSLQRWQEMAEADKKGVVTHEYAEQAFQTVWEWIPQLKNKFHFDATKKLAEQYLRELKGSKVAQDIATSYRADLKGLRL